MPVSFCNPIISYQRGRVRYSAFIENVPRAFLSSSALSRRHRHVSTARWRRPRSFHSKSTFSIEPCIFAPGSWAVALNWTAHTVSRDRRRCPLRARTHQDSPECAINSWSLGACIQNKTLVQINMLESVLESVLHNYTRCIKR